MRRLRIRPKGRLGPQLLITHASCTSKIIGYAEKALPDETGGVLVGYRTTAAILVVDALEVPDPMSTPTSYRRDQRLAQRLLDDRLSIEPQSSPLGFVGDWHSHTRNVEASPRDLTTVRANAMSDGDWLALLVIAHTAPGWAKCAYVSGGRETWWKLVSLRSPMVLKVPIAVRSESEWLAGGETDDMANAP